MILAGIEASFHLFNLAWKGVIRSPISWHDRTPVCLPFSEASKIAHDNRVVGSSVGSQKVGVGGRGMLLTSDVQMMDDRLAAYWSEFLSECLAVLGTFALVTYTLPWLSLAFIPLVLFFVSHSSGSKLTRQYISAAYYRQTSRELKRLDSILRSHIYSSFGEQVGR
jgi:hypothetical protein